MNQWFLTGGSAPQGVPINLKWGASPYAPYHMESFMIKFTNKYICFYNLFKVKGLETKDNYSREAWSKKG